MIEKKERAKIIGNRITEVLAEKNMSRAELCDILMYDASRVAKIVNNRTTSITLVTAMKIAKALEVPVETLFIIEE